MDADGDGETESERDCIVIGRLLFYSFIYWSIVGSIDRIEAQEVVSRDAHIFGNPIRGNRGGDISCRECLQDSPPFPPS